MSLTLTAMMFWQTVSSWEEGVALTLRAFLAGAAAPLVFESLAGPAPRDSRRLLAAAAAGLAWPCIASFPYLLDLLLLPVVTVAALATDRFHRHGIVLLFLGYAASVLLWLVHIASGLYVLPFRFNGFLGIFAFGLLILLWAVHSPRQWARWRLAVPALLLGMLALWADPRPVRRLSNAHYLQRQDLNDFAAQVHRNGRIRSMWEWSEGYTHSLNGTVVRETRAELDSVRDWLLQGKETALLASVLACDGIDPAAYQDVRRKLGRFQFERIQRAGDYVLFARNRSRPLVYAGQGAVLLEPGDTVPGTGTTVGERIGRWYIHH